MKSLNEQSFKNTKTLENISVAPSKGAFLGFIDFLTYDCNLVHFAYNFTAKLVLSRHCLSVT